MAIGERIRFIRNLRGMTQKWLGQAVGFPPKTADVRMAQYESGSRTPKEDLVKAISAIFIIVLVTFDEYLTFGSVPLTFISTS